MNYIVNSFPPFQAYHEAKNIGTNNQSFHFSTNIFSSKAHRRKTQLDIFVKKI